MRRIVRGAHSDDVKTDGPILARSSSVLRDGGDQSQSDEDTMQLIKALGFAGALILAAIVGGTVIGSALAADETNQTDASGGASEYCDVFMESMATELGVTREALVTAGQTAAGS